MKLIETVTAIQTGRASVASSAAPIGFSASAEALGPKPDGVADIGARRRRRRRDPPLPM
jgi:hypothetical protein